MFARRASTRASCTPIEPIVTFPLAKDSEGAESRLRTWILKSTIAQKIDQLADLPKSSSTARIEAAALMQV
jgi:hypothetical protein